MTTNHSKKMSSLTEVAQLHVQIMNSDSLMTKNAIPAQMKLKTVMNVLMILKKTT